MEEALPRPAKLPVPRRRSKTIVLDRPFQVSGLRSKSIAPMQSTSITIRGIDPKFNEDQAIGMFRPFGDFTVTSFEPGVLTVEFPSYEESQKFVGLVNEIIFPGHNIKTQYNMITEVVKKASLTILISRIPPTIELDEVIRQFQRFGDIKKSSPHKHGDNHHWKCYITYQTYDSASAATANMNKQCLAPGTGEIRVRFENEISRNSLESTKLDAFNSSSSFNLNL